MKTDNNGCGRIKRRKERGGNDSVGGGAPSEERAARKSRPAEPNLESE